jgi:hypothetical protein
MKTGAFTILSRRKFRIGAQVELVLRTESVTGEVVACTPSAGQYLVQINSAHDPAIRNDLRLPVDFPAIVTPRGSEDSIRARIIDMSRSGLGLAVPAELPVGCEVTVEFAHGTVFGKIRHCAPASGFFRAGVSL